MIPSAAELREHAEAIADTHGIAGHTVTPTGDIVYSAHRNGSYELVRNGSQLTSTDGGIVAPQWLDERDTILARRRGDGTEEFDLVEIAPEDGTVTPITDDSHRNMVPRQSPTNPDQIAFISSRDASLDIYTLRLAPADSMGAADAPEPVRWSETDAPIVGYDWSPAGDRIVYQSGLTEATGLYVADEQAAEPLFDVPESEQAVTTARFSPRTGGFDTWTEHGIVFTTNHETGFREIAVGHPDGTYELRLTNKRDTFEPGWTPDGGITFIESQPGADALRRVTPDGTVETVEETGTNWPPVHAGEGLYYMHQDATTAGTLQRNGQPFVDEGTPAVDTVEPSVVTYESFDEVPVTALRYEPKRESRGAVIQAHGGPEFKQVNNLNITAQALVHGGFEVLAPDVRGSTGLGRESRKRSDGDLGGGDLKDYAAGAEFLRNQGHDAVGIQGKSYGGYIALQGIATTAAFDAAASTCGIVNWETYVENCAGYLQETMKRKLGGTPSERPELYANRSPVTHVEDITDPLLVVQGANDPRVPPSEAKQLVESLEDQGIPHEYLLFEDEGHGVVHTANKLEYVERLVTFFDTHLSD
jgi:dipeptidyl aminopeptidase/acylaminoacyl peptidase